jgi:hypothetical protein
LRRIPGPEYKRLMTTIGDAQSHAGDDAVGIGCPPARRVAI